MKNNELPDEKYIKHLNNKKDIEREIDILNNSIMNPKHIFVLMHEKMKISLYIFASIFFSMFILVLLFNKTDEFNSEFFLSVFLIFCISMLIYLSYYFIRYASLKLKLSKTDKEMALHLSKDKG